jgi:hypothetical protein
MLPASLNVVLATSDLCVNILAPSKRMVKIAEVTAFVKTPQIVTTLPVIDLC